VAKGLGEEPAGGRQVALPRNQNVDDLPELIHRPTQIDPPPSDLDIGFDVIDAGPLDGSRRFCYGTPAYCSIYFDYDTPVDSIGNPGPKPTGVAAIEKALAEVDVTARPATPSLDVS
jgi:hypothetical protein